MNKCAEDDYKLNLRMCGRQPTAFPFFHNIVPLNFAPGTWTRVKAIRKIGSYRHVRRLHMPV